MGKSPSSSQRWEVGFTAGCGRDAFTYKGQRGTTALLLVSYVAAQDSLRS